MIRTKITTEAKDDDIINFLLAKEPDCIGYLLNVEDNDENKGLLTLYLFRSMEKSRIYTKLELGDIDYNDLSIGKSTNIDELLENILNPDAVRLRKVISDLAELNSHAYLDNILPGWDNDDFLTNKITFRLKFLLPTL